jgi:hypothetical protein
MLNSALQMQEYAFNEAVHQWLSFQAVHHTGFKKIT